MSEPTREQIKEAFKKTIERWEKIVEEPTFYHSSSCALCQMHPTGNCQPTTCPVAIYTSSRGCIGTPYQDFNYNRTPANAIAELNFLRKVYIWWMEKEEKGEPLMDYLRKEEKKEELEDVTTEIKWHTKDYQMAEFPHLLYGINSRDKEIVYVNESGKHICHDHTEEYRLEQNGETFRILKRVQFLWRK